MICTLLAVMHMSFTTRHALAGLHCATQSCSPFEGKRLLCGMHMHECWHLNSVSAVIVLLLCQSIVLSTLVLTSIACNVHSAGTLHLTMAIWTLLAYSVSACRLLYREQHHSSWCCSNLCMTQTVMHTSQNCTGINTIHTLNVPQQSYTRMVASSTARKNSDQVAKGC
jgi:hypothetical protein